MNGMKIILLFMIAVAVILSPVLLSSLADAAPTVEIVSVKGMQPGWVRVYVKWTSDVASHATDGNAVNFRLTASCAAPTSSNSLQISPAMIRQNDWWKRYFDVRVDKEWMEANGFKSPCRVTKLDVQLRQQSTVIASHSISRGFSMDVPFTHLHPQQFNLGDINKTKVLLDRGALHRRHAAYPPNLIAVKTDRGAGKVGVSFIEVSVLGDRGTLGLRALSTFVDGVLVFEVGGGAEIFDGWGIDADGRGVTKTTSGLEESHPGVTTFTEPKVLPAKPLYPTSVYLQNVLDNRAIPRALTQKDKIDLVYDKTGNRLIAKNGARLLLLDSGPISPLVTGSIDAAQESEILFAQPQWTSAINGKRDYKLVSRLDRVKDRLSKGEIVSPGAAGKQKTKADRMIDPAGVSLQGLSFKPVGSSAARGVLAPAVHRLRRLPSPQELEAQTKAHTRMLTGPVSSHPVAQNVLGPNNVPTRPLAACGGMSVAGFRCPTLNDPILVETLPHAGDPGSDRSMTVLDNYPPYYAGRDNNKGTCGTQSIVQYYESLVIRAVHDLSLQDIRWVDGEAIPIPYAVPAVSPTASLWNLYADLGRKPDNKANWPSGGDGELHFPMFADAYWPAREGSFFDWVDAPAPADYSARERLDWCGGRNCAEDSQCPRRCIDGVCGIQKCANGTCPAGMTCLSGRCEKTCTPNGNECQAGERCGNGHCVPEGRWWQLGFCVGQGQPTPGIYRNYSAMKKNAQDKTDPWSDPPWSVVNSDIRLKSTSLPFNNQPNPVDTVLAELRKGLPVRLSYASNAAQSIPDGNGRRFSIFSSDNLTWYIPPEIGAADIQALRNLFAVGGGHWVNIVGYVLDGPTSNPNPFNSYFILANNWGKAEGYKSYHFMNFAAFRVIGNGIVKLRLDMTCPSEACQVNQ